MARENGWESAVAASDVVVCAHAQIGGINRTAFEENNIAATKRLIDIVKTNSKAYVIHISSSVVNRLRPICTRKQKRHRKDCVVASGVPSVVLRPTLMFGWFDRKHIAWLARFMQRFPVFPIPGDGRYLRQPLYVGDFCNIIIACIAHRPISIAYNISGQQKIDYIDLMRLVRDVCKATRLIFQIPYRMFWGLLWLYALFDHDPPFTTEQLEALVTPDIFEVIDWPSIFGTKATPLRAALEQTYCDPIYSKIELEF